VEGGKFDEKSLVFFVSSAGSAMTRGGNSGGGRERKELRGRQRDWKGSGERKLLKEKTMNWKRQRSEKVLNCT